MPSSMCLIVDATSVWASAASAMVSRTVGVASHIRNSTVPKSGWGRMSHHTSRIERMQPDSISVDMNDSKSDQSASGGGSPAVGSPSKIFVRAEAQPGVVALEVRARRRQREEQRVMAHQLADDADRRAAVGNPDVNVHAADQHAPRRPLEVLDEVEIPLVGADDLFAGQSERMGARR